jgi:hypothetical protein
MEGLSMSDRPSQATRRRLVRLSVLGTLIALAINSPTASGNLVIEAPNILAAPGSPGAFDILIRNDGVDTFEISAFTLHLSLVGGPGAQFFPAPTIEPESQEYIFIDSIVAMGLVDFSSDVFPADSFVAADIEFAPPFFRAIGPGDVFGLALVFFELDLTASGTWDVSIGAGTSLSDSQANLVPFSSIHGSITTIPEPASGVLLLVGTGAAALLSLGALARRWRSPPRIHS